MEQLGKTRDPENQRLILREPTEEERMEQKEQEALRIIAQHHKLYQKDQTGIAKIITIALFQSQHIHRMHNDEIIQNALTIAESVLFSTKISSESNRGKSIERVIADKIKGCFLSPDQYQAIMQKLANLIAENTRGQIKIAFPSLAEK